MKNRVWVSDLRAAVGKEVVVCGFVQRIRDMADVQFLVVRDATGAVQVVNEPKANPQLGATVTGVTRESAVIVRGTVVENPVVKLGGIEIKLSDLTVVGPNHDQLPVDPFGSVADLDKRTDWRYLDLRHPKNLLIFKIQTLAEMAMREFWLKENFIEIHSPKLLSAPSESGAELFELKYFETTAYLAQSPQFYKQMAMAAGFEKVFEIGPVFRANPSFTSRHDTEFTSVDVEISWVESHEDVMQFEERWLQHTFQRIKEHYGDEIKKVYQTDFDVPTLPFPRIKHAEAAELLRSKGQQGLVRPDGDLDPQGERFLADYIKKQHGHEFVFIIDYPITVRPFYHMRYPDAPTVTKSFDLVWRGLEITTGAQREHRYDVLREQAIQKGLTPHGIQFYLDFFKHGCPPHGGFGFGLTRMLMMMLGLKNVREVTYLYRSPARLTP